MGLTNKEVVVYLRSLQKKLIVAETMSQSFYTKIASNSAIIMDILSFLGQEEMVSLFHGKKVKISLDKDNVVEFQKAVKIYKNNERKTKDTGTDLLYFGWPYVTGYQDKTAPEINGFYRAPLFLWKAKVTLLNNGSLELSLLTEQAKVIKPILNYVLASRVAVANKKNIDVFNIDTLDLFAPGFVENAIEIYKNIGCEFSEETKKEIADIFQNLIFTPFAYGSVSKAELAGTTDGFKDVVKSYCTLGIFTFRNISLIELYNKLINNQNEINFFKELDEKFSLSLEKPQDFLESEISQITELDYTQKQAIIKALREDTVIQGPPGTGKSQIIANIIANAISKNDSVLFVSEKYSAAEVIEKRLNKLGIFAITFFDLKDMNEKSIFYSKILELRDVILGKVQNPPRTSASWEKALNDTSLDKKFEELVKYDSFLNSENTRKYLEYIKNNERKFPIFKTWSEAINKIEEFENENDFWYFIEKHKSLQNFCNLTLEILVEHNISSREVESIKNIMNNFSISELNSDNKNRIIYFLKTGKVKQKIKINFFNKKSYERIFIANKKVFDFLLNASNEQKEVIKKMNIVEHNKYFKSKTNPAIMQLENFIDKYGRENFNYAEVLEYKKNLKFRRQNLGWITFDSKRLKDEIKQLLNKKIKIDIEAIYDKNISAIVNMCSNDRSFLKEFSELASHASGSRRRGIDWALNKYKRVVSFGFPVIITSPDIAALLFKEEKFDYIVIDEASQVTVERALPILALGKTHVISGDKQQLRPSSFFQSGLEEDFDELQADSESCATSLEEFADSNSLLEYVEKKYKAIMLNYHYRSQKIELIQFSNAAFYNGKLVVVNVPKVDELAIELVDLKNSAWNGKDNLEEAKRIVKKVEEIVDTPNHGSIGIITFNVTQKKLIEDLLDASKNPNILIEMQRTKENGDDDSLFVKNLESVQGDERDNIIISITYSPDTNGKLRNFFGPINASGGENRINVAVSRSREKMYVFKSFHSSLVNKNSSSNGVRVFHDFLEYVENITKTQDINSEEVQNIFNNYLVSSNEKKYSWQHEEQNNTQKLENDVYETLINVLDKEKYDLVKQVYRKTSPFNFVIKNKEGTVLLAIDCNESFDTSPQSNAKEKSFYKQHYVESRGWKIYHINALRWYEGKEEKEEIVDEVLNLLSLR